MIGFYSLTNNRYYGQITLLSRSVFFYYYNSKIFLLL